MENTELEQQFELFGPLTDEPCVLCGEKPARLEPRFNYVVCIEHFRISPVEIGRRRTDL